jgi:hypothetical protein
VSHRLRASQITAPIHTGLFFNDPNRISHMTYGSNYRRDIGGFLRVKSWTFGPSGAENPLVAPCAVQGYLTHKKTPTPLGPPRTLGEGLR